MNSPPTGSAIFDRKHWFKLVHVTFSFIDVIRERPKISHRYPFTLGTLGFESRAFKVVGLSSWDGLNRKTTPTIIGLNDGNAYAFFDHFNHPIKVKGHSPLVGSNKIYSRVTTVTEKFSFLGPFPTTFYS